MEFVSVKVPKDKWKFVKLLKAEKIRAGEYDITDSKVIGEALQFAYEHASEFIASKSKKNVSNTKGSRK